MNVQNGTYGGRMGHGTAPIASYPPAPSLCWLKISVHFKKQSPEIQPSAINMVSYKNGLNVYSRNIVKCEHVRPVIFTYACIPFLFCLFGQECM